jgi:hypothetical protein
MSSMEFDVDLCWVEESKGDDTQSRGQLYPAILGLSRAHQFETPCASSLEGKPSY